jgi:hypothetical protein
MTSEFGCGFEEEQEKREEPMEVEQEGIIFGFD